MVGKHAILPRKCKKKSRKRLVFGFIWSQSIFEIRTVRFIHRNGLLSVLMLLIFYLALSKESKPIIIDQPEDNLDNQSVYSKLVPCICRAKQKRQVIIVTHNPNIAVACDAEQIIYCEKKADASQIRYESGAIENPAIRNHVVDVLEGTMPAFDLRRLKYN